MADMLSLSTTLSINESYKWKLKVVYFLCLPWKDTSFLIMTNNYASCSDRHIIIFWISLHAEKKNDSSECNITVYVTVGILKSLGHQVVQRGEWKRRLTTSCKCKAHYTMQHENQYSDRVTWGKGRKRLINKTRSCKGAVLSPQLQCCLAKTNKVSHSLNYLLSR